MVQNICDQFLNAKLVEEHALDIRCAIWQSFYGAFHADIESKREIKEGNKVASAEQGKIFEAFWKSANCVYNYFHRGCSRDFKDDQVLDQAECNALLDYVQM